MGLACRLPLTPQREHVVRIRLEALDSETVLPEQLAVSKANDAFNADGSLKDDKQKATLAKIAGRLVDVTRKLS